MVIRVMQPMMPSKDDIIPYLSEIDSTGIYSNFGPLHNRLVARLSDYLNVDPACIVLFSNATVALQSGVSLFKPNSLHSAHLPAWTFTATASSVLASGVDAKFVDVDSDWRAKFESHVSLAIDVLPFGDELRSDPIRSDFQVIDGAASIDSLHGCGPSLPPNSILVISMHATKLIGAGEGGVCVASSPDVANELKSWSNFGFEGTRISQTIGTNAKLSEYSAAIALASLDRWKNTREILDSVGRMAIESIKDLDVNVAPSMDKGFITPYWVVQFKTPRLKELAEVAFMNKDIETRNWWSNGCHKMPAYKSIAYDDLSNTEVLAKTTLGLPFHAQLSETDIDQIRSTLISVLSV